VAGLARATSAAYPEADRDLLLAAALLHDAGRVDELEFDTAIGIAPEGRLAGHIAAGVRRIDAAAGSVGAELGRDRLERLRHAVLAHDPHGMVAPVTLEAILLGHADRMDVEASAFVTAAGEALRLEREWTGGDNAFGRPLLAAHTPAAAYLAAAG
jgi:3'-5' exoribonuclease